MEQMEMELDLRDIFRALRRRLWLLIILPFVAALAAGILSYAVLDPVYSASTTLWVIKDGEQINYNDLLMNRNLTKTYAEVGRSRAVLVAVIEKLGLQDVTVKDLQEKLTVTAVRDTEILSFTMTDEDPVMAATLADAVAEAFQGQIRSFMKVENVSVVDPAMVPTEPVSPRKLLNIAIALVLGAMVAVGLVLLLEYLDTTIKSADDVARHLGLPVLGTIPTFGAKEGDGPSRRKKHRSSSNYEAVAD